MSCHDALTVWPSEQAAIGVPVSASLLKDIGQISFGSYRGTGTGDTIHEWFDLCSGVPSTKNLRTLLGD